ncbi:hypothetical protein IGB42_02654 [Andreprevotia sp. IGB-42]|uniref:hypothetical protein n=1 Tax=Andreprevotia sp. IGB-42 TaxID=2497473 RepID=UPI001358197E|nr:hypothetical protein [Andreprevotia sp. IGB-42]KAF0812811.1 hypothetical protein IGB42_02654 [Andreprevotia sp. IGB-42]
MAEYKQNSRIAPTSTAEKPLRALAPLTDLQRMAIAQKRDLVHQHLPELVPFIADLAKAGLIDGWRSVTSVTTPDGVTYGNS